jgi:glycine oxidase
VGQNSGAVGLFYNGNMRSSDVIIMGAGIIGLSLALTLRRRGFSVLIVDRGEPGREASHAAGGMLADCMLETPLVLQPLATASARMYPEFVHQLEDESGMKVDLRDNGTILFPAAEHAAQAHLLAKSELPGPLAELEPNLVAGKRRALFLHERSVDPRSLVAAAIKAAKHRGVDFSSGDAVTSVVGTGGRMTWVFTSKTKFSARIVVNCAGAWSSQFGDHSFPTRPVKGQMLAVVAEKNLVRHVIRAPEAYIIPRSDGRIVIGATLEEAGYDKRTDIDTIQRLRRGAISLVPKLAEARILEDWAGLRPGTPDNLPILGATSTPGYFVATGHFRDGILLAPITARVMAQVICSQKPDCELGPFSPSRFVPQYS